MTEYGRSPGSEPWHPTDPLYGDQGWEGGQQQYPQQAQQYGHQDPYGQQQAYADGMYEQHSQQQHAQQPQGYDAQHYGGQQYANPGGYDTPGYPAQPYDQQQNPQHGGYDQQQGQQYDQRYDQQQGQQYDQRYDGNWETGQAAMPYNAPPADPYGGQQPDLYGTPEAYPPPQPPGRRQVPPQPVTDWDAEPQEEEHPFFTGADDTPRGRRARRDADGGRDGGRDADHDDHDEYDDEEEEPGGRRGSRSGRERRGDKGRKAKNGMACLVVAAVLVGGVGGIGYFGYKFWQGQFGEAPDYAGEGSGEVQVEIPQDAGGYVIGNILKKAGVVKSVDAFVSAQQKNPKGLTIQAGVYTLKKEMSAESAVALMLSPVSKANFVLPPGKRNIWVYDELDKRLDLKPGTTKDIAKKQANSLGLPDWATNHPQVKDPLEGFLFPATYPVAKGTKPEDVLRKMVSRANGEYAKLDLDAKAKELGLDGPWELVTVASLVQVEGKYKHDFDKVARVVYNRLKPGNMETVGRLEFDSTVNYVRGQSTLDVGKVEDLRKIRDPYNTYRVKGMIPGPISNPGLDALHSAMNPTPGPWYYFVSINENKTVFAVTIAEHNKNVAEYEREREKSGQ
ncbi:endolytic transglycosylase MltG [Streptomyces roseicoloratus]|uniref:endolytic transglycosylase MltG n=1 Tax=Streptomyces roseicoloratus TaxID=2508722 RepID=UPI001009A0AC|nr:endolytic transglycosylase MltG [Streptomyces roseicoloratus]